MMRSVFARSIFSFAIAKALLSAPVSSFAPANHCGRGLARAHVKSISCKGLRPVVPATTSLRVRKISSHHATNEKKTRRSKLRRKIVQNRHHFIIAAAALLVGTIGLPSPCFASSILSHVPSPNDLKVALVSVLDGLSNSGVKGMVTYTLSFILWTMTIGATTPMETAAGMAFPLQKAIPLSAIGKITGAFCQYALAKYLFSDYARKKMKNNEWMDKINGSFKSHPYRVALIWRFSPLPEFVKNIGPALVPTLRTKYQILAILTHGLPFTVLWSCMGSEAARVARGGQASLLLKRAVAVITWVGLVVSPTLFGLWVKGLGDSTEEDDGAS